MSEVAVIYAALILHDDGIPISRDKIHKLLSTAGVSVEGYWVDLFVDYFKRNGIGSLLTGTAISGGAPAGAVSSGGPTAEEEKKAQEKQEEKKKEEEEVVELASGFDDLFG
jgi:large subunit ribosomal protein LP1